jgi:hypothetical protein
MSTKMVSVSVEDKSYDVGQAVVQIVKAAKDALADGFQPGQDIPVILTSAISQLVTILGDAPSIPVESSDDLAAFIKSWSLAGLDIAALFLKK